MESEPPKKAALSPWPPLLVAALFILPVGHFLFLWMLGAAMSAGSGGSRIGLSAATYLLGITLAPLALSVVSVRRARTLFQTATAGATLTTFGCLSAASALAFSAAATSQWRSKSYAHQQALLRAWRQFAKQVNPEIASYVLQNPSRVRPTGDDEIVEIAGLADFIRAKHPDWAMKGDALLDPWRRPIKIGMDLDRDGWIMHGAKATGVWRQKGSSVAIGVHSSGAEEASGRNGSEWSTEGGVIEN